MIKRRSIDDNKFDALFKEALAKLIKDKTTEYSIERETENVLDEIELEELYLFSISEKAKESTVFLERKCLMAFKA